MGTLISEHAVQHVGRSTSAAPSRLFGYDVIRPLGEGAGSLLYVVRDPQTGRQAALKHVVRKTDKDVRFIDQLVNEYEVGRAVGTHPNLRKMIDLKLERTLLRKITSAAVVMELVEGDPLDQRLPPTNEQIVDCFLKVAAGLAAMHKAGYVHCDLKPANIICDGAGNVRVIDLGQACKAGTQKERIQGTPDYISPEQVKRQPVDERTDVYNFGATMYWCLCGERMPTLYTLEKGENSFLVDAFIKSPRDANPLVPEALSAFVMECVRTNPSRRPPNMATITQRLEVIALGMRRH